MSASRCALRRANLSGFDTTRTPTMLPSMMSSTRADTTAPSCTKTLAGWPLRTAACGRPWAFLATFIKKRELRYGPTTGRMAARTLPPPSVQTTTSSESMLSRPDRSPVAHAARKRSVSSRPCRRSASKRCRRSSMCLRARTPSWRQAAGDRPSDAATSSNE